LYKGSERKATWKESREGPSPYQCAAQIAPTHPSARHAANAGIQPSGGPAIYHPLLMLKRFERQMETLGEKTALHDVLEKKGLNGFKT
jgi:hypothetical protein